MRGPNWARIRPRVTGAWSSPHSVQCFALLHCSANHISAECCLAFATPRGYRKFLGCLGQLAPTTLPRRVLVSNLSLRGPLSLRLPKGVCVPLLFLFNFPMGFSPSLSALGLCLVSPLPPLLAPATQAYRRLHGGVLSSL